MKASHYVTPRTIAQGEWHESGEALHNFPDAARPWLSVEHAAIIAAALFAVSLLFARFT